jgi:ribosome biogenesis GTPase
LGFDDWFNKEFQIKVKPGLAAARIIEVNKNAFAISDGDNEIPGELSGNFLYQSDTSLDIPTVGDWVLVQYLDENTMAIIKDILPRKSLLKRKTPGRRIDFQLIAANVDFAFIIEAADSTFNLNRIERYLVMVNDSNIHPIILLNKCDLISNKELMEYRQAVESLHSQCHFFPFSIKTRFGFDKIAHELKSEKTYCLLGQSGVGKTSLLNALLGEPVFQVNPVRDKDHKGRHTTTRRQMICLESGSLFIDTPGLRELGNFDIDAGLSSTFDEIMICSKRCRFKDCTHTHEKGCAVLAAVREGDIAEERYRNFLKIQKEMKYYQMSYLEKRRRDKEFGKMVKRIKKEKKKYN